jgi:hypothetical protein
MCFFQHFNPVLCILAESVFNKEEFVEQSNKLLSLCHHLQVGDETWPLVPALLNDLKSHFCKLNDIKIELVEQKMFLSSF